MTESLNVPSKKLTKGDEIGIYARGAHLSCTVKATVPGGMVIALAPDGKHIVAVPSRLSENYWVDIRSPHDASRSIPWSHGDRQFEVGEFVEIHMQADGEKGTECKTVCVMQSKVVSVDAEATHFEAPDYPFSADGENRRLTPKELVALMKSVTHIHVRAIGD